MPRKTIDDLTPEEREKKCFDDAVKYLAIAPRSEKEVVEKLYQKGYHKNEVEHAIERCKHYKYINDEAYVKSYVDYYGAKLGKKKLAYKLTVEKGVNQTLVSNALEDLIDDDEELEKCKEIAAKYVAKKHVVERKDLQKVSAYLYSKGFDFDVINKAINALNIGEND